MAGGTQDVHRISLAPFPAFFALQQSGVFADSAERRTQVMAYCQYQVPSCGQQFMVTTVGSFQSHPICQSLSDVTVYKNVEYHYQQDSGNGYKEDNAERLFP